MQVIRGHCFSDSEAHALKFFTHAKYKFKDWPWKTFLEFRQDVGLPSEYKKSFCKKNPKLPNSKDNCFWGSFRDYANSKRKRFDKILKQV